MMRLCKESLQFVRQSAYKKRLQIVEQIDPAVQTIVADERRLRQMLVNLLSNAVKFTPEGGRIGLEVRADQDQQRITITVWDTGIGISPEDQQQIFEPFVQLKSGLNRRYEGTGWASHW
ncbi:MAG: hypothetical protein HC828_05830 [Blastochloris sp.]|nr:hypothetical protein [Blastochloris sp.]